jgi:hypothetical protein
MIFININKWLMDTLTNVRNVQKMMRINTDMKILKLLGNMTDKGRKTRIELKRPMKLQKHGDKPTLDVQKRTAWSQGLLNREHYNAVLVNNVAIKNQLPIMTIMTNRLKLGGYAKFAMSNFIKD